MFKAVLLHWLGAFKCLILPINERIGWSCKIMLQTDRRTQPFIVKDIEFVNNEQSHGEIQT